MENYKYNAFVRYENDSEMWSTTFIRNLEDLGLSVWHRGATKRIRLGEKRESVEDAMDNSAVFLLIVSPATVASQKAQEELAYWRKAREESFVPIFISLYECPDEYITEREPVNLSYYDIYNHSVYQEKVVELAKAILGSKVNAPCWSSLDIPVSFVPVVVPAIWQDALDLIHFLYEFSSLWRCFVERVSQHDNLFSHYTVQNKRKSAYIHLYKNKCHCSLKALYEHLKTYREDIVSASNLAKIDGNFIDWCDEIFERIDNAAKANMYSVEEESESKFEITEEDDDIYTWAKSEATWMAHSEKIEKERFARDMRIGEDSINSIRTKLKAEHWDKQTDEDETTQGESNLNKSSHSQQQYDLFLAHAGADVGMAEELYRLLSSKYRTFLDKESLRLGDDWDTEIAKAQRVSRVTVVLISDKVEKAYYQREEIAAAIDLARRNNDAHRVVPIYLNGWPTEASDVPYGLRIKHGLDATKVGGMIGVANELSELVEQLIQESASTVSTPTSPSINSTTLYRHIRLQLHPSPSGSPPDPVAAGVIPDGEIKSYSLSTGGWLPWNSAPEAIDWVRVEQEVRQLVQDAKGFDSGLRPAETYGFGLAPLPAWFQLGLEWTAWGSDVTVANERRGVGWDRVSARRGDADSYFEKPILPEPNRMSGLIPVSLQINPGGSGVPQVVWEQLDRIARQVGSSLACESVVNIYSNQALTENDGRAAFEQLKTIFTQLPSRFPRQTGLMICLKGPVTLAWLAGLATNRNLYPIIELPYFHGGQYHQGLGIDLRGRP